MLGIPSVDAMLAQMTPAEFEERMAFALIQNEQPKTTPDGGMISTDDPDFERKFLGRDPSGFTR